MAQSPATERAPDTMAARVLACASCHGAEGEGTSDVYFPRLAGKPAGYLYNQLVAFRDARRKYPPMNYLLDFLPAPYLKQMAEHFASLRPPFPPPAIPDVSKEILARGEAIALVDPSDRFDPGSASAIGLDLGRLLWVRGTGDAASATTALKAMNLVLQAGNFGLVALDLADVPAPALRAFPFTTWLRLARVIEGTQSVALLLGAAHLARSAGGVTLSLDRPADRTHVTWRGASHRARLLSAITLHARLITARSVNPEP